MIGKILLLVCVSAAISVVSSVNNVPSWVESKREAEEEVHYLAKREGNAFLDFFGAIFGAIWTAIRTVIEWTIGTNFGRSMNYAFKFQDISTPFSPGAPGAAAASGTPAANTTNAGAAGAGTGTGTGTGTTTAS